MDTPHKGLNADTWESIYGDMLNSHGQAQFGLWSATLADLARSFAEISSQFAITSTYSVHKEEREDFVAEVSTHSPRFLN